MPSQHTVDTRPLKANPIIGETTPLLTYVEPVPIAQLDKTLIQVVKANGVHEDNNTPLPRTQILLLCCARVVEPIAFFSIFPYVNSMIEHVGSVNQADVGFYSGIIESLFCLTSMCVMVSWGKAADQWGRKPVLVFSLSGLALATTLFGMSQSIQQMIFARCFAGIFAGTVVTIRAMFCENSTKHTQAKAFSYFAFAGSVGIFAGQLIGGALERPADKYSVLNTQFFRSYPYALPGLVTSAIALSAAVMTLFFVDETLGKDKTESATSNTVPLSAWQLIKYPGVWQMILIFNYAGLLAITHAVVNPIFLYTPIRLGGIGFSPELIAASIGISGISQALWLLVFPKLHKRFGTRQILYCTAIAWPIFFMLHPGFHLLLRYKLDILFWSLAPPALVLGSGIAISFTTIQLLINEIAPPDTLATLNGVVLGFSSGIGAFVPALATSLYAIGVGNHVFGGQLFWLINILLSFGFLGVLRLLPREAKSVPNGEA